MSASPPGTQPGTLVVIRHIPQGDVQRIGKILEDVVYRRSPESFLVPEVIGDIRLMHARSPRDLTRRRARKTVFRKYGKRCIEYTPARIRRNTTGGKEGQTFEAPGQTYVHPA